MQFTLCKNSPDSFLPAVVYRLLLQTVATCVEFNNKQVVRVIWPKAASPPHINGSIVFARWRQYAPHLILASLGPTESSPRPKRYLDRLSRFYRTHDCDRQTDRSTDHATPSVAMVRIDAVLRCGLKIPWTSGNSSQNFEVPVHALLRKTLTD